MADLCNKAGGFGQLVFSGNATLTATDNKIVMTGVVPAIALEKGDVIQIEGAGAQNAKLRTIESLHTNGNEVQVNYEHCGARGNGSLKLENFTGPVTIKRIAKWYNAPLGLGQADVNVTALRTAGLDYPVPYERPISVRFYIGNVGTGTGNFLFTRNGSTDEFPWTTSATLTPCFILSGQYSAYRFQVTGTAYRQSQVEMR